MKWHFWLSVWSKWSHENTSFSPQIGCSWALLTFSSFFYRLINKYMKSNEKKACLFAGLTMLDTLWRYCFVLTFHLLWFLPGWKHPKKRDSSKTVRLCFSVLAFHPGLAGFSFNTVCTVDSFMPSPTKPLWQQWKAWVGVCTWRASHRTQRLALDLLCDIISERQSHAVHSNTL